MPEWRASLANSQPRTTRKMSNLAAKDLSNLGAEAQNSTVFIGMVATPAWFYKPAEFKHLACLTGFGRPTHSRRLPRCLSNLFPVPRALRCQHNAGGRKARKSVDFVRTLAGTAREQTINLRVVYCNFTAQRVAL